jgi:hypothetical protein
MSPTIYLWFGSKGSVSQYTIMDSIMKASLAKSENREYIKVFI